MNLGSRRADRTGSWDKERNGAHCAAPLLLVLEQVPSKVEVYRKIKQEACHSESHLHGLLPRAPTRMSTWVGRDGPRERCNLRGGIAAVVAIMARPHGSPAMLFASGRTCAAPCGASSSGSTESQDPPGGQEVCEFFCLKETCRMSKCHGFYRNALCPFIGQQPSHRACKLSSDRKI